MVHSRHHDLITGSERASQGAGHVQREGRHVVAKDDLVRGAGVEEVGHGQPGLVQHLIGLTAGFKGALVVRIALQQIALDAVQALLRDLSAARIVQEDALALE